MKKSKKCFLKLSILCNIWPGNRPGTPLDRMKLVDTVIRSMRVAKVYRDNQVRSLVVYLVF
jgi:hypothetical protein